MPTDNKTKLIGLPYEKSAYEMKNNCCLFERLFKIEKNGIFLFGKSIFVVFGILMFLYYSNYESDDIIHQLGN